jgi:hypothetical protein
LHFWSETRNPKQIHWILDLRACFGFRASDLKFAV